MRLNAATETLREYMRDKAHAMTRELFKKAGVITSTTGQRALRTLLGPEGDSGHGPEWKARALSVIPQRMKEAACKGEPAYRGWPPPLASLPDKG